MISPFEISMEDIDGDASSLAVDPQAEEIRLLVTTLLNMTCDDRRFVLDQPSIDNKSSLGDLIESLRLWSPALKCGVEIGSRRNNSAINYVNGSSNTSDTANNHFDSWIEHRLNRALLLYIPMIIYVIGLIGNTLSFSVLTSRRMYNVSSYTYLAALAVADSLVLTIGLLPVWIEQLTGSDIKDNGAWLCRLISVTGVTFSDYSVWLIVAVTVERYIVVCHPLRAAFLCQRQTALRVSAVIFVLVLAINLNLSWTMDLRPTSDEVIAAIARILTDQAANLSDNIVSSFTMPYPHSKCMASIGYEYFIYDVWPWIDACLYSVVPFLTLVILNVLITRQVVTARRHHAVATVTAVTSTTASVNFHRHTCLSQPLSLRVPAAVPQRQIVASTRTSQSARICVGTSSGGASMSGGCLTQSNAIHIGVMLSTVTVAFLVTTLPMTIVEIVKVFVDRVSVTSSSLLSTADDSPESMPALQSDNGHGTVRLMLARTVCEMLMYTNHSINFFLYCAAGGKFRCELVALGRRVRRIFQPASHQNGNNLGASAVGFNQSNAVMMTSRLNERDFDTNL